MLAEMAVTGTDGRYRKHDHGLKLRTRWHGLWHVTHRDWAKPSRVIAEKMSSRDEPTIRSIRLSHMGLNETREESLTGLICLEMLLILFRCFCSVTFFFLIYHPFQRTYQGKLEWHNFGMAAVLTAYSKFMGKKKYLMGNGICSIKK